MVVVVKDDVITSCRRVELTKHVTGQPPPPPCSWFTFTSVGERRAALFGGKSGFGAVSDDLLIVELSRDTVVSVVAMWCFVQLSP